MDSAMFSMLDIVAFAAGAYALFSWYAMVKKKEIKKTFLFGQDVDFKKCKDVDGYISFISPKLLVFSIILLIYGLLMTINDFFKIVEGKLLLVVIVLALVVIVWYAIQAKKAVEYFF